MCGCRYSFFKEGLYLDLMLDRWCSPYSSLLHRSQFSVSLLLENWSMISLTTWEYQLWLWLLSSPFVWVLSPSILILHINGSMSAQSSYRIACRNLHLWIFFCILLLSNILSNRNLLWMLGSYEAADLKKNGLIKKQPYLMAKMYFQNSLLFCNGLFCSFPECLFLWNSMPNWQ